MYDEIFRTARGPAFRTFLNPLGMVRHLWRHRELTVQLARRDIAGRYRAAQLGLLWSVLTPLILLVIYTFVFAVVFKAKWFHGRQESNTEFALTMFCGMIVFNLFAEVINRSPSMIVSNPNYVKKVVFPLEAFVPSGLLSALFTLVISLGVWAVGLMLLLHHWPPITLLWMPVVLLPVCLMTLGIAWLLASLGVFIRDLGHAVVLATQVLFFVTPIFYRKEIVPARFQRIMEINPLTHAVADARRVLMYGVQPEWVGYPDWRWWLISLAGSAVLALVGYAFFMKSKRAFADVL